MKATVNRNLNVRQGAPSVNAPNPAYFIPGDVVEIASSVIGDRYKSNNVWYRLSNEMYIWSGGVTISGEGALPDPVSEFDFSKLLQFNNGVTIGSGGQGGVIAMMDSGVSHTSLTAKIVREQSFLAGSTPRDEKGHGTCVAGILCGNDNVIKSLTRDCSIVNFRVARGTAVLSDPVMNALTALRDSTPKVDVLNLSLSVAGGIIPMVQPIIDQLLSRGTVTVVAAGNGNVVTTMTSLQNVIKVCAIPKGDFFSVKHQGLNGQYHYAFVDTAISSTFLNDRHDFIGNVSAYTPVVSSIVLACLKNQPASEGAARLNAALRFLSDSAFPISAVQSAEDFKPMKP